MLLYFLLIACASAAKTTFKLPELNRFREMFHGGVSNAPNRIPLVDTRLVSALYSSEIFDTVTVHQANAWNKLWGLKCPANHVVHSIHHTFFTELYVCLKVPKVLVKRYDVYELYQPESNFIFFNCPASSSTTGHVTVDRINDYRLLVDTSGYHYLSSKFCLSHYYQLDTNGKDIFSLNYTTTDHTITFWKPPQSCAIAPIYNDTFDLSTLPLTIEVEATVEILDCMRDDRGSGCYGYKPFQELPLDDTTLLTYNVTSKDGRGCASIYKTPFEYESVTYHINSAISNSPAHILVSLIMPVLEILMNSLTYILTTLIDIMESPEFLSILDRIFGFILNVIILILTFIKNVVIPRIFTAFLSIPLKYKFLSLLLLAIYLKTTKFVFSLCIVAMVSFCIVER